MGIQQDSRHKRRATGGKRAAYRKHRKFLLGRQSAHTKLGETRVRTVRTRGGNTKLRALRLDSGIFSWGAEGISRKARILEVVYNGANNEFVRTNTLVRGEVVLIDSTPFRLWWESHYGVPIKRTKKVAAGTKTAPKTAAATKTDKPAAESGAAPTKTGEKAKTLSRAQRRRTAVRVMDPTFEEHILAGRVYAMITSRPGQTGRIDGYLLDGKELEFYVKKTKKKSGK
jgi:small subunit ribosomal protein S8e